MDKDYLVACVFVTCIKLLFIPMYHSTDMEVHRNWMAITSSSNISEWYFENTSEWTLDYPPFFAWFEYILSYPAGLFDIKMLDIKNLNYDSFGTIWFMRLSVIVSDMVYIVAVMKIYHLLKKMQYKIEDDPWVTPEIIFAMLMLWNPGLLLVDHIHFQYNGFLYGFLFLSVAAMMQENFLTAALWYAVLLNLKHLYIYLAPAYVIYLFKNYCFKHQHYGGRVIWDSFSVLNFLKLAAVVMGVFLVSFAPFLSIPQLQQVFHQMFPVKRGLTHAYWAPNIWALYNALDRVLVFATRYWTGNNNFGVTNVTKGLIDEHVNVILPTIGVQVTSLFTLISILPFLYAVWKGPKNYIIFIECLCGCAFGSFIFGYHVHEKAVAMIILPMTLLAITDHVVVRPYTLLSSIGHFALFPLLYKPAETPIKFIIVLLHSVYAYRSLRRLHSFRLKKYFSFTEILFHLGIVLVQLFYSCGHLVFNSSSKFQFLPLMLISCFCSIGILYCWVYFCRMVIKKTNWPLKPKIS